MTTQIISSREQLSKRFVRGSGIEIGALHTPLPVSEGTIVRYVDRMTVPELHDQYPELSDYTLIVPDIVDDGEHLSLIPDKSQDFVIANHFLEHSEDPIGTLLNFFRVLKTGGIAYLAIPDKRHTFDMDRPVTTLAHLIADHAEGPEHSREAHYREWVRLVDKAQGQAGEDALYKERTDKKFSIHFHVWTEKEIMELMEYIQTLVSFELLHTQFQGNEHIVILRKQA